LIEGILNLFDLAIDTSFSNDRPKYLKSILDKKSPSLTYARREPKLIIELITPTM
jgi:hypothetical protein